MITPRQAWELIWLGRHLERADFGLRVLGGLAAAAQAADPAAQARIQAASLKAACPLKDDQPLARSAPPDMADHLLMSPVNRASVRACMALARSNARECRALVTDEVWEALNTAHLQAAVHGPGGGPAPLGSHVDEVRSLLFAVRGAIVATQPLDDALACLTLGDAVERADGVARLMLAYGEAAAEDAPETVLADILLIQAGVPRRGPVDLPGALERLTASPTDLASLETSARRIRSALEQLDLPVRLAFDPQTPSAAASMQAAVADLHGALMSDLPPFASAPRDRPSRLADAGLPSA
ncbi:MAG: alpha-E domain-containing protein [Brevundimonas sp.]|uniref:alpha-E domain-containing protein n=1 Tax=Brevundimonas sp. TaxID=1871086 RepID=UPI00391CF070